MYLKNNNCIAHCWFSTQQLISTPFCCCCCFVLSCFVLMWVETTTHIRNWKCRPLLSYLLWWGRPLDTIVAIERKGDFVGELMGNIFLPDYKRETLGENFHATLAFLTPSPHNSFLLPWRLCENMMLGMAAAIQGAPAQRMAEKHIWEGLHLDVVESLIQLGTTQLWALIIQVTSVTHSTTSICSQTRFN